MTPDSHRITASGSFLRIRIPESIAEYLLGHLTAFCADPSVRRGPFGQKMRQGRADTADTGSIVESAARSKKSTLTVGLICIPAGFL